MRIDEERESKAELEIAMIRGHPKKIFRKKKQYIFIVCVPSFHLSARSSSFFLAFFHFCGTTFFWMTLYLGSLSVAEVDNG